MESEGSGTSEMTSRKVHTLSRASRAAVVLTAREMVKTEEGSVNGVEKQHRKWYVRCTER